MRNIFLLAIAALLMSCQDAPPPPPVKLTFTRYQPIFLDVASIEFINEYKSPMRAPNVEHLMPYSPEEALRIWVKERVRAVGMDKSLHVIIKDASVTSNELPTASGFWGMVGTGDQDRRYDFKLAVEMRIYGEGAMSLASVEAHAERSTSINGDASVATRDAIFRRVIFDMMESVNAELEKNMYMYFGGYINYSHNP